MRHKYETRGIILARTSAGEAGAQLSILTDDLGLLRARATGVRRAGARLAHALTTFAESELVLVEGKEGWRVAGAVLVEDWFARLAQVEERRRAGRVAGLLLRLAPGEVPEAALFPIMVDFFGALGSAATERAPELSLGAELIAASGVLAALGFGDFSREAGPTRYPEPQTFSREGLVEAQRERERYVARINRGILASGL